MKEIRKRNIGSLRALLYVICGLVIYLIIYGALYYISNVLDFPYATYVLYVLLAGAALIILRWCITEFTYTLTRSRLKVQRKLGRKNDEVLNIALSDIVSLQPYTDRQACRGKVQDMSLSRKARQAVIYRQADAEYTAILSASSEFVQKLTDALSGENNTTSEDRHDA